MPASNPRLDVVPCIASGLAITVAALVLAGWTWDIDPLKRVLPGLVSMNPMTAVAFVLAGISLWLQRTPGGTTAPSTFRRRYARFAAAVVVAIGLIRLAAVALGWDTGIDQWLFTDQLADDNPAVPNRMAPNTALNLALLGSALLLLELTTARNRRPAELLAALVMLISLLALFGYAYQVPQLYGVAAHIPMALHTAIVSFLLALGILFARPGRGLMALAISSSMGGVQVRRLLPATVLVLFLLGGLRLEGERRGLYGMELGVALYTLAMITILSALVWWSARSLHRIDTEREGLAALQRDAEERVRLLLDSTAEAIYGIDTDGHCTFINRACAEMLGYASEDLLGKDMHALIHHARPDGTPYPAEECHIYRAVRSSTPAHVDDEVFWRADGTSLPVEYWSYPMRRDGRLVGAVVTFLDITARKAAEEGQRQSQEQTRAIIATATDAFVAIDRFGVVIDWNARAETTFGWPRAEVLGRRLSETIIPARYRQAHDRGLDHYLATGEGPVLHQTIELEALHRDSHEFPVEITIWPVTSGLSTTFNAFVRDITERRRVEASIRALNAELTANADQLQQTNRELEAFSYTVSHDLRAPLRHIGGYAKMLQEDAGPQLDAEMRRYLDAIGDSARHMGVLIDDLLAFSRMGRKPVERIAVDMDALAGGALQEARASQPGSAKVSLGPLPPVHADPALLRQVWVNLLSNALKYSATRGSDARIEVSGESDQRVVRYQVRDNGVGFDMRYADKLFGVFQRLHSQDEFEGTGVGLAIVQRIVTRHGGRVWAAAEAGQGATFTFELPIARDHVPDGHAVPAVSATEASA